MGQLIHGGTEVDRCELTLVIAVSIKPTALAPVSAEAVVVATRVACEPVARAVNTPLPLFLITKIDGDRLTTICSNLIFKGAACCGAMVRIVIPFH